jgi:predicted RNase H-like HicB family nuclease
MCHVGAMKTRITYWKETDGKYLGYLNDYPDHWTQGEDLEDLKTHLRDLFETFSVEEIPGIKKEVELEIA